MKHIIRFERLIALIASLVFLWLCWQSYPRTDMHGNSIDVVQGFYDKHLTPKKDRHTGKLSTPEQHKLMVYLYNENGEVK